MPLTMLSTRILLTLLLVSYSAASSTDYVQDACRVTRYRQICVRSLSPFSTAAKRSRSKWARAGVSVALREAESVARYLARLKKSTDRFKGRQRGALLDCIELFQEATDELHRSLGVLRKLSVTNFGAQMGDLDTWLSSALTDQDTCLDGFEGTTRDRRVGLIRSRVLRVSYYSSNALALANKLASAGLDTVYN